MNTKRKNGKAFRCVHCSLCESNQISFEQFVTSAILYSRTILERNLQNLRKVQTDDVMVIIIAKRVGGRKMLMMVMTRVMMMMVMMMIDFRYEMRCANVWGTAPRFWNDTPQKEDENGREGERFITEEKRKGTGESLRGKVDSDTVHCVCVQTAARTVGGSIDRGMIKHCYIALPFFSPSFLPSNRNAQPISALCACMRFVSCGVCVCVCVCVCVH